MQHYQFIHFDPQTGDVPDSVFGLQLPEIARRARAILKARSSDEIGDAAWQIDLVIDQFFDQLKRDAMACQDEDCEPDAELEFPSRHAMGEVWAFKQCYRSMVSSDDVGFTGGKDYEYFAVLALWKIAEALDWLEYKSPLFIATPEADPTEVLIEQTKYSSGLAACCALEAMDATCYAEHLQWLETLGMTLERTKEDADKLAQERVRQIVSSRNRLAADTRHAVKTYPVKAYAFDVYFKNRGQYKTVYKAAKALYADVFAYARKIGSAISEPKLYRYFLEAEKNCALREQD